MKTMIYLISFLFCFQSHAKSEDGCQEAMRLSCQDVTVNLDEGTGFQNLSQLALYGRQIIPDLKNEMIEVLKRYVSNQQILNGMIDRIKKIEVVIDEKTDVMSYTHDFNRVNVGMLFFKEVNAPYRVHPSLFSFIQAVSHEIAHAVDPCLIQVPVGNTGSLPPLMDMFGLSLNQAISSYPISSLQCLANSNVSVGIGTGEVDLEDPQKPELNKPLCRATRLNESLSDYLAAEVLSALIQKRFQSLTRQQLIHGVANIYSIHCHAKSPAGDGPAMVHPNAATRLAWIVLKQPVIRTALQCDLDLAEIKQYCH